MARRPVVERTPPAASARAGAPRARRRPAPSRRAGPRACPGAAASSVRNVSTIASSQESPRAACLLERGHAGPERGLERRRVLARDSVPIGREPHHIEPVALSARSRRPAHPPVPARPARRDELPCTPRGHRPRSSRRAPDRARRRRSEKKGSGVFFDSGAPEKDSRPLFRERRARDGRQQQDDAEIRVRARPPRRGLDGEPHRCAERRVPAPASGSPIATALARKSS